jgi:hypothetical protein
MEIVEPPHGPWAGYPQFFFYFILFFIIIIFFFVKNGYILDFSSIKNSCGPFSIGEDGNS